MTLFMISNPNHCQVGPIFHQHYENIWDIYWVGGLTERLGRGAENQNGNLRWPLMNVNFEPIIRGLKSDIFEV